MTTYDQGDQPVVTVAFANVLGAATNPTTVKFVTRNPSGTEVEYVAPNANITNPSTGTYVFTFPTAVGVSGTWEVRARGTAGLIAEVVGSFVVIPSTFTTA